MLETDFRRQRYFLQWAFSLPPNILLYYSSDMKQPLTYSCQNQKGMRSQVHFTKMELKRSCRIEIRLLIGFFKTLFSPLFPVKRV